MEGSECSAVEFIYLAFGCSSLQRRNCVTLDCCPSDMAWQCILFHDVLTGFVRQKVVTVVLKIKAKTTPPHQRFAFLISEQQGCIFRSEVLFDFGFCQSNFSISLGNRV